MLTYLLPTQQTDTQRSAEFKRESKIANFRRQKAMKIRAKVGILFSIAASFGSTTRCDDVNRRLSCFASNRKQGTKGLTKKSSASASRC
jgi:ABC-type transporter Mla maintaining outer membrane lipid asymmetry ATPase subunit MlaF